MEKRKSTLESKILDMVEEDLHAINEIKDVSRSIKRFNKLKYGENIVPRKRESNIDGDMDKKFESVDYLEGGQD